MNYSQAIDFIKQRRKNDLIRGEEFYHEAVATMPELGALDSQYRAQTLHGFKTGDYSDAQKTKALIDEFIEKHGLKSKIYPAPHCNKCNDTGFAGDGYCDCVKALTVDDSLIAFPLRSFSDVDKSLFAGKDAEVFFRTASDLDIVFRQKFPDGKKRIFSLIGGSGTGKTFLASCAAGAVSRKGHSVVFITAFEFVKRATKYHTTFDDSREMQLGPLFDCDLLIIDDLGTEAIYKNVTLEYLYLLINERQLKGKYTFITSNLSIDSLKNRYGERIVSRLLDKKTCYVAEFNFGDVRRIAYDNI